MESRGRHLRRGSRRKWAVLLALMLLGSLIPATGASAAPGGPVVMMGIDAEDGSPFSAHGPISVYADVVQNGVLTNVTNAGTGILVIGGGKAATDNVTFFWNTIGTAASEPVTYVNGAAISTQSFAGFKMIAVASSSSQTPSGGLTQAESDLLNARGADVADFVNGGGGLFGLTQAGLSNPYGYLGVIGTFTVDTNNNYDDITPTAEGAAVGVTDALDVFAWHDYYDVFPSFLTVLAIDAGSDRPAAIGGVDVVLPGAITLDPPTATNPVGTDHTVVATVRDSNGDPIPGVQVDFEVTAGPNVGVTGSAMTDSAGQAPFTYTGSAGEGTDTIRASFVDATSTTRSTTAEKVWEPAAVQQATINVVKLVDSEPDGVFDDDPSGWTFEVSREGVGVVASDVTSASGELTFTVDAGDGYSVLEADGPSGFWHLSWICIDDSTSAVLDSGSGISTQGPSDLDLVADQAITCTFENQLMAGHVTGVGQIIDDDNGALKKNQVERISFGGNVGVRLNGELHGQWQANFHNVSDDTMDNARFHSTSIDAVTFQDMATLEDAAPPQSLYNFVEFEATGRFNGEDGWSVTVRATDTGEPGNAPNAGSDTDSIRIQVRDSGGVLVYDSQTDFPAEQGDRHQLDHGNVQIHPAE